jgi:60 kDa SS-A/Ro ribonucleoprotein
MTNYQKHLLTNQFEKAREDQVQNNCGAYVYQVTPWQRLERFLILGCEAPAFESKGVTEAKEEARRAAQTRGMATMYQSERALTRENAAVVLECAKLDPERTVQIVTEISHQGRAAKQSPGIFALALLASCDSSVARKEALAALPAVCRTASTLFEFISIADGMRGWGSSFRNAVASWYTDANVGSVAWQMMKYRNRNGWNHKDVLRKAHPQGQGSPQHNALFRWVVGGSAEQRRVQRGKDRLNYEVQPPVILLPELADKLAAFEQLQATKSGLEAVNLLQKYGFTHEMVPNDLKSNPIIWEAMLPTMPPGALVRNLGKLSSLNLATGDSLKTIVGKLTNPALIRKARLHPVAILIAAGVYGSGRGVKGKLTWSVSQEILRALDAAFYLAFENVPASGKSHLVAVDVSGSMHSAPVAGCGSLTAAQAAVAMAMVTLKREPNATVLGFSGGLIKLSLKPTMRLEEVLRYVQGLPFSNTDCSLPFRWALENKQQYECFSVHTDSETNSNREQPAAALQRYRQKLGISAKLAVCAYSATGFTIADPKDSGMLDCVGLDASLPRVLLDFFGGSVETTGDEEIVEESEETV